MAWSEMDAKVPDSGWWKLLHGGIINAWIVLRLGNGQIEHRKLIFFSRTNSRKTAICQILMDFFVSLYIGSVNCVYLCGFLQWINKTSETANFSFASVQGAQIDKSALRLHRDSYVEFSSIDLHNERITRLLLCEHPSCFCSIVRLHFVPGMNAEKVFFSQFWPRSSWRRRKSALCTSVHATC